MNPDALLGPVVTAIVKYDLYPYYHVTKGRLRHDGGIDTSGASYYRPESVIKVLPASEYEPQKDALQRIEQTYREKERQLRIDILEQNGVDFVTVK